MRTEQQRDAEEERKRLLRAHSTGRIERTEDGFKITEYDPSRAPAAKDTVRGWIGERGYGPYSRLAR